MSKWAFDNQLTMNNFYFARGIGVEKDTQEALRNPDDTYLFVFRQDEIQKDIDYDLNFYKADAYVVGTTFALRQERYQFDEF